VKIIRTYPAPDSANEKIGPRERAMAVYKYLLSMEPEAAVKDKLFPVLTHAFMQEYRRGRRDSMLKHEATIEALPRPLRWLARRVWRKLDPALDVPVLGNSLMTTETTGEFTVDAPVQMFGDGSKSILN